MAYPHMSARAVEASVAPARGCIAILALGRVASEILRDGVRGEVIAVFRRSFYVRFGADVICLGGRRLGHGPLNVLCGIADDLSWFDHVANQAVCESDGSILRVGDRLRFERADAAIWHAPVGPVVSVPAMRSGLERLAAAARQRSPGGLGKLLASHDPGDAQHGDAEGLLRHAVAVTGRLRDWLAATLAGSPQPPPSCEPLIGLGPGLTPSGDDFLCGVMAALHYLGRGAIARRLAERILPIADGGTSLISACYLRCASEGQASEVLFEALRCIVAGGESGLDTVLDAVDAVGHTSGWDSLAGAAAVCAAWCAARGEMRE